MGIVIIVPSLSKKGNFRTWRCSIGLTPDQPSSLVIMQYIPLEPIWSNDQFHHLHHPTNDPIIPVSVSDSILLVDFPIGLMAYNVLSGSIDRGYLSIPMLRAETFQDSSKPSLDLMQMKNEGRAKAVNEELGWLAEFCGHSFPSRAILLINGPSPDHIDSMYERGLRSVLTGVTSSSVILCFNDLRDSIELMIDLFSSAHKKKLAATHFYFIDETVLQVLKEAGWTEYNASAAPPLSVANHGALALTIQSADDIDQVIQVVEKCGKIFGHSGGWRDTLSNIRVFKVFVEFFDCNAAELAYHRAKKGNLFHPQTVGVEFCSLHRADREFLFFGSPSLLQPSQPPTPTSLSSEDRIIRRPRDHRRSISTLSLTPSVFSVLSEYERVEGEDDWQKPPSANCTGAIISKRADNEIDLAMVESGRDRRTTCMIKNIPNKYTQQMLIDHLDESHSARYDFIYLRMDFKNKCNVGYAFINFLEPNDICSYAKRMVGRRWSRFNSEKRCELAYARIQGKEALVEKFRNSRVMQEPPSYRPRVFDRSASK